MAEKIKVAVYEPGREREIVEIEPTLKAMQKTVGGLIEPFNVLEDEPMIYVNEEGLINGMAPNRAVYASREMAERGYLSQMDGEKMKEGDLMTILMGPILAMSYEGGEDPVDITQRDLERLDEILGSVDSGIIEVIRIKSGMRA